MKIRPIFTRGRLDHRVLVAGTILGLIVLMVAFAPWLAPHDPRHAKPVDQLQAPSWEYIFGTDLLGRDVFSRVLYGGQNTLRIAALTLVITVVPGLAIGVGAGYTGRWIDDALMMLMDVVLAFPNLLLALALVALLGAGTWQIAFAVGVAGIPAYARVTRAAVLEARTRLYIEAARGLGARQGGILWRHVIPSVLPTLLAFAGVTLSWAILNSATLLFLGYGGDISAPDWGVMLADGRQAFRTAPWVAAGPGIALSLTVFAINLLASGLGARR